MRLVLPLGRESNDNAAVQWQIFNSKHTQCAANLDSHSLHWIDSFMKLTDLSLPYEGKEGLSDLESSHPALAPGDAPHVLLHAA